MGQERKDTAPPVSTTAAGCVGGSGCGCTLALKALPALIIVTLLLTSITGCNPAPNQHISPPDPSPAPPLFWNTWIEDAQDAAEPFIEPLSHLETDTPYQLVLDLSAFAYPLESTTSEPISRGLARGIERLSLNTSHLTLEVLVLVDPDFLVLNPDTTNRRFRIDVSKIRELPDAQSLLELPPTDLIPLQTADSPLLFGRRTFELWTTGRQGATAVTFSFWAKHRPVGELTLPICVGALGQEPPAGCLDTERERFSWRGFDSLQVAGEDSSPPDAALHFVEHRRGRLRGVLWCATAEDYAVWSLERGADEIAELLERTILPAFDWHLKTPPGQLQEAGLALYNTLFPRDPTLAGAAAARTAFESCFADALATEPFADPEPPSLFVRFLGEGTQLGDLILPAGILAVGETQADTRFLGSRVRLEVPLPRQTYAPPEGCIETWHLMIPEGDDDQLNQARDRLGPWLDAWARRSEVSAAATLEEDAAVFIPWLQSSEAEMRATALAVLSHHQDNALRFDSWTPPILAENFGRSFDEPSLVILNGCGTGGPTGAGLVRAFGNLGMEAVLASSAAVDPELAADLLRCLVEQVDRTTEVALGTLHHQTLACLYHGDDVMTDGRAYSAHALTYTLLGNGALRLCPPD